MEYIIGMIGEEPEGMSEADALERSARLVSHISALAKRLCRMIPTEIYDKALLPIRYYLDNRNIIMYPDSVICFGNLVAGKFFNEESDSELLEKVFYYFNDTMISYSPEIIKSGCIMIESIYKKIDGLQSRLDEVLGMINEMLETANLVAISPIMPFICNAVSTIVKESGPYEEPNEAAKSLVQTMIVNLYQKEFDVDNEDGIESANLHYNGVVNLFDAYRECLWIFQHDDISSEKEFLNMIIGLADSLLHIPEIYDELMENYCNFLRKCAFEVNRKNCLLLNRSKIKKVLDNASPKMRAYAEATKEFVRNA